MKKYNILPDSTRQIVIELLEKGKAGIVLDRNECENAIKTLDQLREYNPKQARHFYEVSFLSEDYHSTVVHKSLKDVSKQEISRIVEERTGKKPSSLVLREIFEEEYNLLKEDYQELTSFNGIEK